MNNLALLQARKAELAAKLALQREEIKQTLLEAKTALEPVNLLKQAVKGAFPQSGGDERGAGSGVLSKGISILLDLLVKDPRLSVILKLVTPVALKYLPIGRAKEETPEVVEKELEKALEPNFYGRLRQGVTSLRAKLKHKEDVPQSTLTESDQ
ncbi:MAG TPA: hypothetical protein DCF33_16820 [Saprospirales bacterium]|nr:hypothetical protein [Saprospirales bacterium]